MKNTAPGHITGNLQLFKSLEETAENLLSGDSYDNGALEATSDRACNNSRAIGRLLDWLADRGQITSVDVTKILTESWAEGWNNDVTFVTKEPNEKK